MLGFLKQGLEMAAEHEQTLAHGKAAGLTDDGAREVRSAWTDYYRTTPYPVDVRAIRDALTRRACGMPWRPPSERSGQ